MADGEDHSIQNDFIKYYGYGTTSHKAVKNLIQNLRFGDIYYYHDRVNCDTHHCDHLFVYFHEGGTGYVVTFRYRRDKDIWESTVKYPLQT